jgi:hypothetical protein
VEALLDIERNTPALIKTPPVNLLKYLALPSLSNQFDDLAPKYEYIVNQESSIIVKVIAKTKY